MYNLSLRSLEEPVNAGEEENAGPWQAEHARLQVSQHHLSWLSHLGWLFVTGGSFICFIQQTLADATK